MASTQLNTWIRGAIQIIILASCTACAPGVPLRTDSSASLSRPVVHATLPGQQIWKQGVSSFLFGTNDTDEWTPQNIETEPAIQKALRDAGFTLIRSFFHDNASDAAIEQRIQTIENSGAHCLGVIANIFNVAYDRHLVQYLGNRCLLYEFGNESDYSGISIHTYLRQWNIVVPMLRQINPSAKFIGPVTYNYQGQNNFMQDFLEGVKASHIFPDAISFHWYPCWQISKEDCLVKATNVVERAAEVRGWVHSILGRDVPVGITEWNYDPNNPPAAYGDDPRFITAFTTAALNAMIQAGVAFACQFDAASYSGYGRLDMFDINDNQPKPQYFAIKSLIEKYQPSPAATPTIASPDGT